MKRPIIIAMALCVCLSATGCGDKKTTISTADNTEGIVAAEVKPEQNVVTEESLETSAEETYEEATSDESEETEEINEDYNLLPECPENTTLNLSEVTINNHTFNLTGNEKLSDVLSATGTSWSEYSSAEGGDESYCFDAPFFGIAGEPDPMFADMSVTIDGVEIDASTMPSYGTVFAVELLDENGNLIPSDEFDGTNAEECTVKAVMSDEFFIEEDFEVTFCNGVKPCMTEDEMFALLGEPYVLEQDDFWGNKYLYNNGECTLLVATEDEADENGDKYMVIDEITLFVNKTAVE